LYREVANWTKEAVLASQGMGVTADSDSCCVTERMHLEPAVAVGDNMGGSTHTDTTADRRAGVTNGIREMNSGCFVVP
jgi:hypothetical protein